MAHSRWRSLAPLVLATMTSQALLVVLAPTIVAVGRDLDVPVGLVGQARSITAVVAVVASVAMSMRAEALGVRRLIQLGAALAMVACGVVAMAGTVTVFLAVHALVGLSFALLLSGGFAGVAAFSPERRAWATGFVAGANALAWIVVNPLAAVLTEWLSWRAAHVVPAAIGLAALLAARDAAPVPAGSASADLLAPFRSGSARWWMAAEVVAFGAWTALLTFAGAFFINGFGSRESTAGLLLAAGAAAYFVGATRCGAITTRVPLRRLVAGSALVMAMLLPVVLNATSVVAAVGLFCLIGLVAGVRTPASANLAFEQLPDRPGAMMAARTAATQLGYLIGAVIGGAVIAGSGYGALGLVLAVGMLASAWLVLRVNKPLRTGPPHPVTRRLHKAEQAPHRCGEPSSRSSAAESVRLAREYGVRYDRGMSPHDDADPARDAAASSADTRPRDELADSANGWLRVQLAVVGFIGLCGALWATGEPAGPGWLKWLAAALAVLAFVLGGSAIVLVARVAYPVRETAPAAAPGDNARSRMWRQLRGGIRLSLLALMLVVAATLTAWWPDTSGGRAIEVRDATGQAWCGQLGDASTGTVRLHTADGPATIPLESIAVLREVDSC